MGVAKCTITELFCYLIGGLEPLSHAQHVSLGCSTPFQFPGMATPPLLRAPVGGGGSGAAAAEMAAGGGPAHGEGTHALDGNQGARRRGGGGGGRWAKGVRVIDGE